MKNFDKRKIILLSVGMVFIIGSIPNLVKSIPAALLGILLGCVLIFISIKLPLQIKSSPKDAIFPINDQKIMVVGTNYYSIAIEKLGKKNQKFTAPTSARKTYEYKFPSYFAMLVPEPENKYDSNAIKVLIDGQLVGYVAADDCDMIHERLKKEPNTLVPASIYGGRYSYLNNDRTIVESSNYRIGLF